ncbi:MAG TPA: hypothetical protein VHB21_03865 [Minicystis sp.]|nr:hypothetical protein [Minicystis sp.]
MKHPLFGLFKASPEPSADPLARSTEGWDAPEVALMQESDRRELVAAIRRIWEGGRDCLVREIHGKPGRTLPDAVPCTKACDKRVRDRCGDACEAHPVSVAYAGATEALLQAVCPEDAVILKGSEFTLKLCTLSRFRPEALARIIVMSIGLADRNRRPIVRISRGDGLRTELSLEEPTRATWRTTYRERLASVVARTKFLADFATQGSRGLSSDHCAVARNGWE